MKRVPHTRIAEKVIQSQGVNLLRSLGAKVYVLGTKRRRGDFQGTNQTPGIGDVYALLVRPPRCAKADTVVGPLPRALWWEAKAEGGRLRPEQIEFRNACQVCGVAHIIGGLDPLFAWLVNYGYLLPDNIAHYRHPSPTSQET